MYQRLCNIYTTTSIQQHMCTFTTTYIEQHVYNNRSTRTNIHKQVYTIYTIPYTTNIQQQLYTNLNSTCIHNHDRNNNASTWIMYIYITYTTRIYTSTIIQQHIDHNIYNTMYTTSFIHIHKYNNIHTTTYIQPILNMY